MLLTLTILIVDAQFMHVSPVFCNIDYRPSTSAKCAIDEKYDWKVKVQR